MHVCLTLSTSLYCNVVYRGFGISKVDCILCIIVFHVVYAYLCISQIGIQANIKRFILKTGLYMI